MNIRTKKHGSRTARVPVLNNCKSFPWTSLFQMPCTKPLMSHLSHWILVASVALRNALTSPIFVVPFKRLTYGTCDVLSSKQPYLSDINCGGCDSQSVTVVVSLLLETLISQVCFIYCIILHLLYDKCLNSTAIQWLFTTKVINAGNIGS